MSSSAEQAGAVVTIVAAVMASSQALPVSYVQAAVLLALSALSLRPRLILLALIVMIMARSHATIEGLDATETRPIESVWVEVRSDPSPGDHSWRAEVAIDGERLLAVARNEVAGLFAHAARGDRLLVSGTIRGSVPTTDWQRSRRLVGRLGVARTHSIERAKGPVALATAFRDRLRGGADSLSAERRALFTGLVFGDDRFQDAMTADDFRAAGLGHLLAVSGQNVVFVLLVMSPVLTRIRSITARTAATLIVLAAFGFVTRFEPSVTRALVMVGIATVAVGRGVAAPAVRTLPVSVVGLLLVDPMLGLSIAFRLSVAATCGLVMITPRLLELMDDPGLVGTAVATTGGAQLAVAPFLIMVFGSISVVAVPANLLVAPAASFVMMWGLTAGTIAGFAPPLVAGVLHAPTTIVIGWIEQVAHVSARIPAGSSGVLHLVAVSGALALALRSRSTPIRRRLGVVAIGMVVLPLVVRGGPAAGRHELASDLMVFRDNRGTDVVTVAGSVSTERALEELRSANIGTIDLLVATSGDRSTGRLVKTLRERFSIVDVWAPPLHNVPGARVARGGVGCFGLTLLSIDREAQVQWTDNAEACGDRVEPVPEEPVPTAANR